MDNKEKLIKELRIAVENLISGVRIGHHLNSALDEMNKLMLNKYGHKAYDEPEKFGNFSELNTTLTDMKTSISSVFGNAVYYDLYETMMLCLNSKETAKYLFDVESIDNSEELLDDSIGYLKKNIELIGDDVDGFSFWIDYVIQKIGSSVKPVKLKNSTNCPCCGMPATKMPSSVYLGDSVIEGAFVYVCEECNTYAYADKKGEIMGVLADKETHKKRGLAKKAVGELMDLKGLTYAEAFMWAKNISGFELKNFKDIEKLNAEQCNKIISGYLYSVEEEKKKKYTYPKNHKELMEFLEGGGRLRICKSFAGDEDGKLLIPLKIGDSCFTVKSKQDEGEKRYDFPNRKNLTFEKDKVIITHPSNKREVYKMYPHSF